MAELQQQLRSRLRTARAIENDGVALLERWGDRAVIDNTVIAPPDDDDHIDHGERLNQALEAAKTALQALRALRLPDAVRGASAAWIFMATAAIVGPAVAWLTSGNLTGTLVGTVFLTAGLGIGLTIWLRGLARQQAAARFRPLLAAVRQAELSARLYLDKSAKAYKRKRSEIRRQRDAEYARATEEHAPMLVVCRQRRENDLPKLTADADLQLVVLQRKLDEALAKSQEVESQLKAERAATLRAGSQ